MQITLGQTITLKKKHPCGADTFTVVRTGADYKLQCNGCGAVLLFTHDALKKSLRLSGKRAREEGEPNGEKEKKG